MNNLKLRALYTAMLKHEGKITRCEEVEEGLFAIEYEYLHPFRNSEHFSEMGAPATLDDQLWLGDRWQLAKYINVLHDNLDNLDKQEEKYNWQSDREYVSLTRMLVRQEKENATRNDRDIQADIGKEVHTGSVRRSSPKRIQVKTITPEP